MFKLARPGNLVLVIVLLVCGSRPAWSQTRPFTVWPVSANGPSGLIQIFQPQPESLTGDQLKARAAVSMTPAGANAPVFGAVWMTARLVTDRDARTAEIADISVRRVKFPDMTDEQSQPYVQALQQRIPSLNITLSLDQLMASLDAAAKEKEESLALSTTPPKIIVTTVPATLVLIDGTPQLQPVADQPGLMRIVNTPFVVLFDSATKRYFLKAGNFWYVTKDVVGPWQNVPAIPGNVLAAGNALSAPPLESAQPSDVALAPEQQVNPGQIIVSEEPAELISTDGAPSYTPLPGNSLLYVSNSQADVFLEVATQQTYVLLSGRWYRSASLEGPWEYVPADKLPTAFAQIPEDSPKANVLASIAGTIDAKEAKLEAQIPQTAAVSRDAGQSLAVAYDGPPQFEAVPQTTMSYCVNTPEAVLLVDGRYYCCHQAVWYEATGAVGPWTVCLTVPPAIYTLPPSCPIYGVRYCYVYGSTADVVYCGYLAGYTGCFNFGPTVVYGTGYFYHGWYRHDYYPRPCTFGFGVRYDPFYGSWGLGASCRFDRNWLVKAGDHHGWWGPRGFIDYHSFSRGPDRVANNVTIHNTTINRLNIYNRSENVRRKIVVSTHANDRGRNEPAHETNPAARGPAHVENNVYAGHDGTIYRRTDQGWEQHSGTGWTKVNEIPEGRPAEHAIETPVRPAERGPAHVEQPTREPAHIEQPREPAHITVPERQPATPPPTQIEPDRGNRGLEIDRAARERGMQRGSPGPQQQQQQQQQQQRQPEPQQQQRPNQNGGPNNNRR